MVNFIPPHVALSLAAARLRQALRDVQDLVKTGHTSGADWIEANARQALAEQAWRAALKRLTNHSYRDENSERFASQAYKLAGE